MQFVAINIVADFQLFLFWLITCVGGLFGSSYLTKQLIWCRVMQRMVDNMAQRRAAGRG
jgi:hypothetical protein